MKNYKIALHIFRRDLRLQDNTALIHALKNSEHVICCFILDPRQTSSKNSYKSDNAVQFMINSLEELHQDLIKRSSQLYLFKGEAEAVIEELIKKENIDFVTFNQDITPFSIKRDQKIASICKKAKIDLSTHQDTLLQQPEKVTKADGKPYTVYTPFMRNARPKKVSEPARNNFKNYYQKSISKSLNIKDVVKKYNLNSQAKLSGGRTEGLKLLAKAATIKDYKTLRDIPAKDQTTHLSAHNKFGTISIREAYKTLKEAKQSELIKQLYWRDFFSNITYHFPHVIGKAFKEKYQSIKWKNSKKTFQAWCEGQTGFPIVDAGMRELNATGFMHNRVRMITASFLIKDLHIDWRWGEQYFARKLIDYDPAVNNGNWQWVASTGCDAQPYFRIFNPWLQQKRFDPDCLYIKKWIPELKQETPQSLHNLFKKPLVYKSNYPNPIVVHADQVKETKKMYL